MDIQEELKKLGKEIDAKLVKSEEQAKLAGNDAAKAIADDLKTEVKNMTEKWMDLQKKQQEQLDALETRAKRLGGGPDGPKPFSSELHKNLEGAADKLKAKKQGGTRLDVAFDFQGKAVSDMLTTDAGRLTGQIIQPYVRPGIIETPFRFSHVREAMTVMQTTSPVIYYLQENGGEGSPGMVAEGALKPQIDYDLSQQTVTVKKIAAHLRLSEEMIEDIPFIVNYVTVRGMEDLMLVEDAQILYGDGTGQNLRGITIDAPAFAAGSTVLGANATIPQIIRVAMGQIRNGRYQATAVMLNPADIMAVELAVDTTGQPLFRDINGPGITGLYGIQIIESDAITPGSFIVGDFRRGAELFDRKALNVRFYDQDRDNAIRNMVTIVIEERLALANVRPASFVKGTFAAARTDLAS